MLVSFLMRVVARLVLGVFVRSSTGRRQLRQAMGQIDIDNGPLALRAEDREADMSRDAGLPEGGDEGVAEHGPAKVAAGNGRQVFVTLVDHHGMLRSEKILDSRIDERLTQHDLVRGGG